jgi:hypothetical protein
MPDPLPPKSRCRYVKVCYLAEELKCAGFRLDCALYRKTNNQPVSEQSFHDAMDRLINKIKAKHEALI